MEGDATFMRRAIELARAQVGRTGDNPAVGCVIVAAGAIVAEAATGDGGRPHAEESALALAGAAAGGGAAYVTLEPCAQRSSGDASCSRRLVEAGIARVVVASTDASVLAAGRGQIEIEAAGATYESGFLADEADVLLAAYRPRRA